MSIMELDPPDYWLIVDDDSGVAPFPTYRAWTVAPLECPNGDQVLLVRVDPPYWMLGHAEQDFVALRPVTQAQRLHPLRPGTTCIEVCRYLGTYDGQTHVRSTDLAPDRRMVAFGTEDLARQAEAFVARHQTLPAWAKSARDAQTRRAAGCLAGLWSMLGR